MATTGFAAAIDSNSLQIGYIAEVTWGTTPATPAFQLIRIDSEGFSSTKTRSRPNEINTSKQASAAVTVKQESTGSLNFSVSNGLPMGVLFAASMGGVWTTPVAYTGTDVAITVADSSARTCTLTATGGAFTTTNALIIGQFVKVCASGTFGADCSFIGRLLTVAATTLTFDCVSSSTIKVAAALVEMGSTTIKGSCLRNGTTFNSFTFEKKFSPTLYLRYTGVSPTDGSLEVGVGDFLKATMGFLNKSETSATSAISGSTYVAAPTGTVINSVSGIGAVWRGVDTGVTPGVPAIVVASVQKMGIKWSQESSASQFAIGSPVAAGVRTGNVLVTGSMSSYFNDFTLYLQFINEQAGPISFHALDGLPTAAATKGYMITFCNATIMNPKIVAGGAGQDVMADFEIEGNPDISSTQIFAGKTIQLDYFA